jgi:hypothetical protein
MYDLTRPHKTPKRYFVAVSSDGQWTATRSSESRIYSHAVLVLAKHWSGEVCSSWCSREDLAEKQFKNMKNWTADPCELVESKEVTAKEYRQLKKELQEKSRQSVSG